MASQIIAPTEGRVAVGAAEGLLTSVDELVPGETRAAAKGAAADGALEGPFPFVHRAHVNFEVSFGGEVLAALSTGETLPSPSSVRPPMFLQMNQL